MILTCPTCASRYRVEDHAVPPHGRTVRCGECGTAWRAEGIEPESPLSEPPLQNPPSELVPEPAFTPTPETVEASAAEPPGIAGYKAKASRRAATAAAVRAVWGVVGAVVVLAAVTALFHTEVVGLWPASAGLYERVGIR